MKYLGQREHHDEYSNLPLVETRLAQSIVVLVALFPYSCHTALLGTSRDGK